MGTGRIAIGIALLLLALATIAAGQLIASLALGAAGAAVLSNTRNVTKSTYRPEDRW